LPASLVHAQAAFWTPSIMRPGDKLNSNRIQTGLKPDSTRIFPEEETHMNFGQAIATCFSKYFVFEGRATRPEFWWFTLFQVIVNIAAMYVPEVVGLVIGLAVGIPGITVGTRRLHDIGKSGWWQLLTLTGIGILVLIYWWVQPSEGAYEYGATSD
jgi:uncharacterized membrane protein YhaH (DUF805 family)